MTTNNPSKFLSRRSSPQTLPKSNNGSSKKNSNKKRNPLEECSNTTSTTAFSIEAPKGCFSFLLSNSSSSKTNIPRSKSLPKTPKRAPLPFKTGTSSHSQARSKPPSRSRAAKPNSGVAHENSTAPNSQGTSRPRHTQSEDHRARSPAEENGTGRPLDVNVRAVLDNNNTPASKLVYGSRVISTPDKDGSEHLTPPVQASISPEIHCTSEINSTPASACFGAGYVVARVSDKRKCRPRGILTVGGDGNLQILEDPTVSISVAPPAEASVQWLVSPGDAKGTPKNGSSPFSPEGDLRPGLVSNLSPSHTVVLSGFEGLSYTPESVIQQLSPCSFVSKGTDASGFGSFQSGNDGSIHVGSEDVLYTPPRSDLQNLCPYTCVSEGTPSSLVVCFSGSSTNGSHMDSLRVHQQIETSNPSAEFKGKLCNKVSGSSPCSFVSRGTHLSGSKLLLPQREAEGSDYDEKAGYQHRYDLANRNSPCPSGSSSSRNVICTPRSDSSFDRLHKFRLETEKDSDHRFDLGSMSEVLQTMNSPRQNEMDVLPLPGLNFQFLFPTTPSNSADQTQFLESFFNQIPEMKFQSASNQNKFGIDELFRAEKGSLSPAFSDVSQMRISWRDGLVSRIFEMDELDCCKWLSDEEDGIDYGENDQLKPNFSHDHDLDLDINSSTLASKYLQSSNAFGSFEFLNEEQGVKNNNEVNHPNEVNNPHLGHVSCAESISTEGGGLAASGDSDWTICYRNQLFQEPV